MSNRERLLVLHATDPHCHWCGIITQLPPAATELKIQPDDLATVDHLFSRLNPQRLQAIRDRRQRTFLACRKCNHLRNVAEERGMPHAELKKRSRFGNSLKPRKRKRKVPIYLLTGGLGKSKMKPELPAQPNGSPYGALFRKG